MQTTTYMFILGLIVSLSAQHTADVNADETVDASGIRTSSDWYVQV